MKLQHYIGGIEGLEPSRFEKRVFVQKWEERIFGIHVAMMALSNHLKETGSIPTKFKSFRTWAHLRTGAEGMNPFDYFKYRYYEKWLGGISGFFVKSGYVSQVELDTRTGEYLKDLDAPLPEGGEPAIDEQVLHYLREGDSPKCKVAVPLKFKVGDTVTIKDPPPVAHCKLPGIFGGRRALSMRLTTALTIIFLKPATVLAIRCPSTASSSTPTKSGEISRSRKRGSMRTCMKPTSKIRRDLNPYELFQRR